MIRYNLKKMVLWFSTVEESVCKGWPWDYNEHMYQQVCDRNTVYM